jgi:hypothetical protein
VAARQCALAQRPSTEINSDGWLAARIEEGRTKVQ